MAQLNITLNQEEILQLLSNDRNEVFRKLLESSLNSVLKAESQEQLKAQPYERTLDRTDIVAQLSRQKSKIFIMN